MKNEPWKHVKKSAETKAKISASMRGNKNKLGATKAENEKCITKTISFPAELFERVESHLKATRGNRSRFVARAVAELLKKEAQSTPAK